MKLHVYFARRFLAAFGAVLGVLGGVLALFSMIEQIGRFAGDDVTFVQLLGLTILDVPGAIYDVLPLIMVLATLTLFLAMARSSELVVTRATGRSALMALISPAIMAFLIGVLAVAIFNPIAAATRAQYDITADRYDGAGTNTLSIGRSALWLRQGDATQQTVIRAGAAELDGTLLRDVSFVTFDAEGRPVRRVEAETARLAGGLWNLENAKGWPLNADNPERAAEVFDVATLRSGLTEEQIREGFGAPSKISIWDLPAFIQSLETAGFSARNHRVWLQSELALPVLLVAMALLGAGFTMRHTRFGRTGLMLLLSLATAFTLYFIRNFAQILGESGQIPVELAAWGVPIAAILLPLGLIFHMEDG